MKWVKRLVVLLTSVLLFSVLTLASAVLFLEESNYKRILGWAADHFLDSQLIIKGPFKLNVSRNISLSSADIILNANDDSYRLAIGKLHFSFRLGSYLQTGSLRFNKLELQDINYKVMETPGDFFFFEDFQIPPVVISQAHFSNLNFAYQELPPGTLHRFYLDELEVKDLGEKQAVSLHAMGLFEEKPFELEGTFDSVAQVLQRQAPVNAKISLSSELINLNLNGTIAEPFEGHGIDLQVRVDIPNLKDIIEIAWDEIPILGEVKSSFDVRGDYSAPRLEEIDLHIQREQEVDVKISGSVADVLKGTGLDLQIEGSSNDPQVLSWLFFAKQKHIQTLQVSGHLQGQIEKLSLHDLDAIAETIDGVKLQANGNIELHPENYRLTNKHAGLSVKLSAPSTQAANFLQLDGIPELGPISGSMALALSQDALGIYRLDLNIGSSKQSQILLKGDVGYVPLQQELVLPELKLQTDIRVANLARLGSQFGFELPELGPARLRGQLVTKGPELLLQGTKLFIGTDEHTMLLATGILGTQLSDPSKYTVAMHVEFQSNEIKQLAEIFDYDLPELGPTRITGWLETKGSELHIEDVMILVGAKKKPDIRASGSLVTQLKKNATTINVNFEVTASPLIAAFSDLRPKYLGRLQGNAVIADLDGDWGIETFSVASTKTDLYQLHLTGGYDDLETYDKGQINSSLAIDNPRKLGEALGLNLAALGAFQQKGQLKVQKGRLSYDGKASLGRTNSVTKISGYLKEGKPTFEGSFTIPALHLADFGVGIDVAPVSPVSVETTAEDPYVFSRDEIDVSFLKNFDLDFAISIDEIESGALSVEHIRGKIELNDGHLAGAHQLVHKAGNVDFNLEVKALAKPEYQLSVIADDLTLGTIMAHLTEEIFIEGYSHTNFILKTRGNSLHEMASNLSGDLDFALENARIPNQYFNVLFVDLFGWVLSTTRAKASHAKLNCVMMTFGISNGEVRSETVIADGQNIRITGRIDMDLGDETLDIVLLPKQKKRMFSSSTPVMIHGPIKDPKLSAIPAKAAAAEIGTMTLFSSAIIPIRLGEKIWQLISDDDKHGGGCTNIEQ